MKSDSTLPIAATGFIAQITAAHFNEWIGAAVGTATLIYITLRIVMVWQKIRRAHVSNLQSGSQND